MKTISVLDIEKKIRQCLKGNLKINHSLRDYTSIKIGGKAEFFIEPVDNSDLSRILKLLNSSCIPVRIIGNGTNLIVTEETLPVAVIRLSAPFFKQMFTHSENIIFARAGAPLNKLVEFSKELCLSGLEFLIGIPGGVGGALAMNAGVRNIEQNGESPYLSIFDALTEIEVMDKNGNILVLDKTQAGFKYRGSALKEYVILGAYFKLHPKSKNKITFLIDKFSKSRKNNKAYAALSAGCIFKNPSGGKQSAGCLIDNSGLKGFSLGGAQVCKAHANFIINKNKANFADVCGLIILVQNKVLHDSGIMLELEVDIWKRE